MSNQDDATSTSTTSAPASAPATPQYYVQHLPDRYIRSKVLDDYINARLHEFGTQWTREPIHDHHCITVMRYLTTEEIYYLQQQSYPGYFTQRSYWQE